MKHATKRQRERDRKQVYAYAVMERSYRIIGDDLTADIYRAKAQELNAHVIERYRIVPKPKKNRRARQEAYVRAAQYWEDHHYYGEEVIDLFK